MLIFTMLLIVVVSVTVAAVSTKSVWDTVFVAVIASLIGVFVTGVIAANINDGRDPEAGWTVVDERSYTLAEGAEMEMVGTDINIVAEINGSLKPITLEDIRKVDFPGESSRTTVVVQDEYRELGTDIFWWGEGQGRTVVSVR